MKGRDGNDDERPGEHGKYRKYGEHGGYGSDQRPSIDLNDLTGYGFVDTTPEKNSPGTPHLGFPPAPGGTDTAGEQALRRLLHGAVDELTPSEGALEHLREAVPARRARKRQAVVGSVAAALLVATAVPAFLHVANTASSTDEQPAAAGHGEQTYGGSGGVTGTPDGVPRGGPSTGSGTRPGGTPDGKGASKTPSVGTTGDTAGAVDGPRSGTVQANSPVCEAGELSVKSAKVGKPDATGKVYGAFRVVNASDKQCAIGGVGTFGVHAQGAADPAKITVVEHAAGDPAPGLPDPSQDADHLVLKPAAAYEVRFAWVPSDTCPKATASPDPSPSANPGSNSGITAPTTTGGGAQSPQLAPNGGPPATTEDGTVAVTHVAEPGAPAAEAKIPNACAGTIYKTGVLDAGSGSAPAP
ncbi:hypothetical protein [Streptomyces sp. NBC_00083]|uniref:hypothetical protein n=1 Tax=Streptomyces sp. NBC_00083 TaxID=2975647 RepID=UPI002250FF00|nr:hypothetical protein [Streptomyces sp. NBC_00083]MCX5388066.1 hypothetical protein [Streptomyces sp. NBC_00083]